MENFPENNVSNALKFLKKEELSPEKVKGFNFHLSKLIEWCRLLISYHFILHPFRIRNPKLTPNTEATKLVYHLDNLISDFYKVRGVLIRNGILEANF